MALHMESQESVLYTIKLHPPLYVSNLWNIVLPSQGKLLCLANQETAAGHREHNEYDLEMLRF